MKKDILRGITISISFLLTTFLGFVAYAAWTDILSRSNGTTIDYNIWNELVAHINTIGKTYAPAGMIGAFNLSSCPMGRIAADGTNGTPDLRGEFLRGLDNGRGVDAGRTLLSSQTDTIKNHRHYANPTNNSVANGIPDYANALINLDVQSTIRTTGDMVGGSTETRPRNIAVLYCIKQ